MLKDEDYIMVSSSNSQSPRDWVQPERYYNSAVSLRHVEIPDFLLSPIFSSQTSEKGVGNDNTGSPKVENPTVKERKQRSGQPPDSTWCPVESETTQRPRSFDGGADHHIIAHDARVQRLMDKHGVAWGTQYEIARGVCDQRWSWEDIDEDKIKQLSGSSLENAGRVPAVFKGEAEGISGRPIWGELDVEQKAINENKDRGLGLCGDFEERADWFGGKIQQRMTLERDSEDPSKPWVFKLERMEMKRSTKFSRFLGSRRILQFKVPKKGFGEKNPILFKKLVLLGRVFSCVCAKEGKVYAIETAEDYERESQFSQGDNSRLSFEDFVELNNPLELNQKKTASKWVARFDLGLSTSIPVIQFSPQNVFRIDDLCVPPYKNSDDAPANMVYTDGCGFMNGAALMQISKLVGYTEPPVAIQGRIFGSKGVWILHYSDRSPLEEPKIWIRDSQLKINLTKLRDDGSFDPAQIQRLHPSHLIFDLVQPSKVSKPSRLGKHTLMNLSHNNVPTPILEGLMRESLEAEIAPFMRWDGPHAMPLLWDTVNTSGRVSLTRLQRQAAGASRALGLSRRQFANADDSDDDASDDDESSPSQSQTSTSSTASSIAPNNDLARDSLAESILRMLQAGFTPLENKKLFDDLKRLVWWQLDSAILEYHIVLDQSAEAFIIPDPYNVLHENEIHFKSSKNLKDPLSHMKPNQLINEDVLLWRNPARLPSDVQRVRAVRSPALEDYVDVIVLPTKGPCSLASLLAGGGSQVVQDTAVCVFDQQLVQNFTQPDPTEERDDFKEKCFESQKTCARVSTMLQEMERKTSHARVQVLQKYLLKGLFNDKIWQYSNFHENAAYAYGFDHPKTIHNAFMFNYILDSRKSGLVAKDEVFRKDSHEFNKDPPHCLVKPKKGGSMIPSRTSLIRGSHLPPFILEELMSTGIRLHAENLERFDSLWDGSKDTVDNDLLLPYQRATRIDQTQKDLNIIEQHIERCYGIWRGIWRTSDRTGTHLTSDQEKEARRGTNLKLDKLIRTYEGPLGNIQYFTDPFMLNSVKASCAYRHNAKFAYDVALRHLCMIKALSKGLTAFTSTFAGTMSISSGAVKVLNACSEEAPMKF